MKDIRDFDPGPIDKLYDWEGVNSITVCRPNSANSYKKPAANRFGKPIYISKKVFDKSKTLVLQLKHGRKT